MSGYSVGAMKKVTAMKPDDFSSFNFDTRFMFPFTMLITGPTGSGKTMFVKELLEKQGKCINTKIKKIYYHFGMAQPLFQEMKEKIPNVEFRKGLPLKWETEIDGKNPVIIVLDDLMDLALKNPLTSLLYTQASHHRNLAVLTLTQSIFPKQKEARTVSLNSHYLVVFKNPRDKLQISTLATQFMPAARSYFLDVVEDATKNPHSYILLDCKQSTPDELRLRAKVLDPRNHT